LSLEPSFFVLRSPLLPFEEFLAWGEGLEAPASLEDGESLKQALARDRDRLRHYLREVFSRPEAREALLVASPDLVEAFGLWERDPESARGQGVERALSRYLARMAGRPTPFGLFAGVSVGVVGERTRLEIEGRGKYRRSSRLDLGYLFALTEGLRADPDVQQALTYRPNATLYSVGGRLRYIESLLDEKEVRHELVAVSATDELQATLARAEAGATVGDLAAALASNDVSAPAAEAYVRELIANDLLVPDLGFAVTGPEPLVALIEELREYPPTRPVADRLDEARRGLHALDEDGVGADGARYRAITETLDPLAVDESRIFQVDLFKPAPSATLGTKVIDELLRGAETLRRLAAEGGETELDRFREAFRARYELREVPLLEALDPDIGLGFPPVRHEAGAHGAPLLADVPFPAPKDSVPWGPREDLLVRKLVEATDRHAHEVVLEPGDLEDLAEDRPPLPDAFAVSAVLAAASQETLDRGDFRLLIESAAGPSGARLLGRFCHGDPQLRGFVEEHLRAEEALEPDAIFAEIVHLPEGRAGNVLCRPVLRDYEITYLGRSGAPAERRIPADDLLVSVRDDKVILRSERLDRRVIPRLTNAHNLASFGTPVYRFLAFLQHQGVRAGVKWSWKPLEQARFLPRVRLGRLVLSLAQWNLVHREIAGFARLRGTALYREVQTWRGERRVPRLVALREGDELLPVDLDNVLSVESFVQLVKSREEASLVELFPGPDELCAEGPEGRFMHELVVPFVRVPDEAETLKAAPRTAATTARVRRRFPPGSDWLSAALYLGPVVTDEVLRESIGPLARELVGSGAAERWFFVRFSDPDWHLRVRFHGEPETLRSEVQPALEQAAGRAWRLRFDTYEREIERYGGPEGIAHAEQLFHVDSEAVLEALEGIGRGDEERRWRLALLGIDTLLADLGLDLEAKESLAQRRRDAFHREFRADARTKSQIGERFRREREALESLLRDPANEAFARRSERLRPLVAELRTARLSISVEELAASFVHVHLNRILRSAHREQELVLWDFLARLYRSRLARDG